MSATQVDGWRMDYVRDLNVHVWRAWVNLYSAGDLPDYDANSLASATYGEYCFIVIQVM
jgi:hypothetical protein